MSVCICLHFILIVDCDDSYRECKCSCGYSDCETDCCIVLSDYLIYAVSEVYA